MPEFFAGMEAPPPKRGDEGHCARCGGKGVFHRTLDPYAVRVVIGR